MLATFFPRRRLPMLLTLRLALSLSGGGRRGRRPRGPRPPPVVLRRVEGGVPEIAMCYPERYESLLASKVAGLEEAIAAAVGDSKTAPAAAVFESPRTGFRMRASFKVWREVDEAGENQSRHLVMFDRSDAKAPIACESYPMGGDRLNGLIPPLVAALQGEVLGFKINDARLLTTLRGDALVALTYNRPLAGCDRFTNGEWAAAAAELGEKLDAKVVGRSRKFVEVVGGAEVTEVLDVPGRGPLTYRQTEGAFSQPNARVCEQMLGWAVGATAGSAGESLCELYCGNGCFTVALAPNFATVVATELSKASVSLAERNLAANNVTNARVARLSAEEYVAAVDGDRTFRRLREAGIDAGALDVEASTLFVDPPRAGLDATCVALAARFRRVVYVSCNPETLARDVAALADTHDVTDLAAFDQFPYTPHLEAGVVLDRRR